MKTPRRYVDDLWTEGTERLNTAFDYYERSEERAASQACRKAIRRLQTARLLSPFIAPADAYPFEEELQRARHLRAMVDSAGPEEGSALLRIEAYDEQLAAGDTALRAGNANAAQVAYLAAFAELVGLLPDDTEFPDEWPVPEAEALSSWTAPTKRDMESVCELCEAVNSTMTVEFRSETVQVCVRCEATLSGRFCSVDTMYDRCAALIRDIRDTVETTHGLPWLSPPHANPDGSGTDDGASVDEDVLDVDAIWLIRDLAAVSQQVGHPAAPSDVAAHGGYPPEAYRATFGSWEEALRQAGFGVEDNEAA